MLIISIFLAVSNRYFLPSSLTAWLPTAAVEEKAFLPTPYWHLVIESLALAYLYSF